MFTVRLSTVFDRKITIKNIKLKQIGAHWPSVNISVSLYFEVEALLQSFATF